MKINILIYNKFLIISIGILCGSCQYSSSDKLSNIKLIDDSTEYFQFKDSVFQSGITTYFIIYNSKNCVDCFKKINNTLIRIKKDDKNSKIYTITTADFNSKNKLYFSNLDAKSKIPLANNVFFEIAKQVDLFEYKYPEFGIFSYFNIDITPCILKSKKGQLQYFPYTEIFQNHQYSENWSL